MFLLTYFNAYDPLAGEIVGDGDSSLFQAGKLAVHIAGWSGLCHFRNSDGSGQEDL